MNFPIQQASSSFNALKAPEPLMPINPASQKFNDFLPSFEQSGTESISEPKNSGKVPENIHDMKISENVGLSVQPNPFERAASAPADSTVQKFISDTVNDNPPVAERSFGASLKEAFDAISNQQKQIDDIIETARTGQTFSPGEILSLQAQTYRLSFELNLASKAIEQFSSGIRKTLETQI